MSPAWRAVLLGLAAVMVLAAAFDVLLGRLLDVALADIDSEQAGAES